MTMGIEEPKVIFPLGKVIASDGAFDTLLGLNINPKELLERHMSCDWGDVCEEDRHLNNIAVVRAERILSAYRLPNGDKVWVITEWDRSETTMLLPEEYDAWLWP